MTFRYRFKARDNKEFTSDEGFATRDTAVGYSLSFTKTHMVQLYVYDTGSFPHRIVGLAECGNWRHPVSTCRLCKGAGIIKPTYSACEHCSGLGVMLEKGKWKG